MKHFFLRFTLFLVTSLVLINIVAAIYGAMSRSRYERDGSETYEAIRRSQTPSQSPAVILGDSVCHQLLMEATVPDTLNLSCNQAISMCGQFLLAREAVAHDRALRQITLAYQPACFRNDLDEKFTFNYLVKPFYIHPEMRAGMDALVIRRLDRRPFYRLIVLPMFRYTDLLGATDYAGSAAPSFAYLSPVSIDYLHRLADLCRAHNIRLRVVSTPISRTSGYDERVFLGEVAAAKLDEVFAGYTATIRQVDPEVLIDNVHFKPEDIRANAALFVEMLRAP